jgi:hypothetical protein
MTSPRDAGTPEPATEEHATEHEVEPVVVIVGNGPQGPGPNAGKPRPGAAEKTRSSP